MAIPTTNTSELNIGDIILRAYQKAGIQGLEQPTTGLQWTQRVAAGRTILREAMTRAQVESVFTRTVELYDITLTASTPSYVLPLDTIDVMEDGSFRESTESLWTYMRQMDREEYLAAPDKDATHSRPIRFWVDRGARITVWPLPIPNVTNSLLKVQRERLLADVGNSSESLDLERYWTDYITCHLAHELALASSLPLDRCGYLKSVAREALTVAQAKARQQTPNQMVLQHRTQWNW